MRFLVTGGAGFIGTNFQWLIKKKKDEVTILDKLDLRASQEGVKFIRADLGSLDESREIFDDVDFVIHLAAETRADRSPKGLLESFYDSNVFATYKLLKIITKRRNSESLGLVHISTDEVFGPYYHPPGSLSEGCFPNDSLNPYNPYAGTKAAAEMLVRAWAHQYGYPTIILRLCNVFGPYQYPEKLIPKAVIRTLKGMKIPLYGDGNQSHEWNYVDDVCEIIYECSMRLRGMGTGVEQFNFTSGRGLTNNEVMACVKEILPQAEIEYVKENQSSQVMQYKMKSSFEPKSGPSLEDRIKQTVRWFVDHRDWWE